MAKFTADIADVSTQHIKPIADKSGLTEGAATADFMKNMGKIRTEVIKGYYTAEAETEYEELATEIKQADAQYSMQDVLAIDDFGQRMSAFRDMAAQGKKSDEMKLRAEALLKQQIARMPGLEQEFRKSAASIIGIDPAGQGVKTAFANMAKEEADAERLLTQIGSDSVTSFGMLPGEVYSEKGQKKYMALAQQRSQLKLQQMELEQLKAVAETGAIKRGQVDLANSNHFRDNQMGYSSNSNTTAQMIVTKYLGKSEITAADIAAMGQDERTAMISQLQNAKRTAASTYDQYAAGFKQRDEFEDISGRVLAPFDDYIGLIEGKTTLEQVKSWNEYDTQLVVNGLMKTPAGRKAQAFKALVGQTNLPAGLDAELLAETTRLVEGALPAQRGDNAPSGGVAVPPPVEQQRETSAKHVKSIGSVVTQVLMDEKASEESKTYVTGVLGNMAEMFTDGTDYKPEVLDSFVDLLNNPQSVSVLRSHLSSNPSARASISDLMAKHVQRSGNGISASLKRSMERWAMPDNIGDIGGEQSRPFIYPELQDGQVVLRIDENAVTNWTLNNELSENENKNMMRSIKKDMGKISSGPLASLNKTIRATSSLYNQPIETAAQGLIQRSGKFSEMMSFGLPSREQELGMAMQQENTAREVIRDENGQLRFK